MATVYRKTEKGQAEIATRQNQLAMKLRSALIMVDGKRTDEELLRMIPGDAHDLLQSLLDQGFIEVIAVTANRPAPAASRAPDSVPPVESTLTGGPTGPEYTSLRQQAARFVSEQLGPMGDDLAVRLEKAKSWAEIKPILNMAQRVLQDNRGPTTAEAFRLRFLDPY
ncbi:hypothetical protein [Caldimonas caldifontis]|uniref:Uncharacterized protein n=1 Tax=Caldimonas caldifontis TaxID=1452508 RepID=A0A2S5SZI6_9BURK|nr:hypothetical protein [Caldimonas caldifontis]PPE68130.1 hypothetical protein C1704_01260 [Caldimonas caldifontis]